MQLVVYQRKRSVFVCTHYVQSRLFANWKVFTIDRTHFFSFQRGLKNMLWRVFFFVTRSSVKEERFREASAWNCVARIMLALEVSKWSQSCVLHADSGAVKVVSSVHLLFEFVCRGGWICVVLHRQWHWICVFACQQHVNIGVVKGVSVCICFLMLLRQWHCTCTVDCQQNVDIGWVVVALVNVVFSVHLLFNFSDVMNGLVLCCTGSGVH